MRIKMRIHDQSKRHKKSFEFSIFCKNKTEKKRRKKREVADQTIHLWMRNVDHDLLSASLAYTMLIAAFAGKT